MCATSRPASARSASTRVASPTSSVTAPPPRSRSSRRAAASSRTAICDDHTWSALVEAEFRLGDRLLCLTTPMIARRRRRPAPAPARCPRLRRRSGRRHLRPGDPTGAVGLPAERRPRHRRGVRSRHRRRAVTARSRGPASARSPVSASDTSCGPRSARSLELRVAIVHLGDADALAGMIGADLHRLGAHRRDASATPTGRPSPSRVNEFGADVCLALVVDDEPVLEVCYFSPTGFSSRRRAPARRARPGASSPDARSGRSARSPGCGCRSSARPDPRPCGSRSARRSEVGGASFTASRAPSVGPSRAGSSNPSTEGRTSDVTVEIAQVCPQPVDTCSLRCGDPRFADRAVDI